MGTDVSRSERIAREAIDLLVSVLLAAFYLLFARGYRIYIGDQRQYFLQPFRELSDGFIPRDWLTWDTTHYHYVFSGFVQFLDGVASTLGCSFEAAVFGAYAVLLVFVFRGVLALVRAVGGDRARYLVVLFLVLCYGDKPSRGLAESFFLPSGYLVPSGIAAALFLYALAALFRSRWGAAWFLLGLSGMAHVNYGMAGAPFFALFHLLLLGRRPALREVSVCAIAFALPFSLTFVPTLAAFAGNAGGEQFAGLLTLAAPGHYAAATWSLPMVLAGFLPLAVGCALAEDRRLRRALIAATAAFAGIYLLQLAGVTLVSRLFFWRVFPCVQLLAWAGIAGEMLRSPRRSFALAGAGVTYVALSAWLDAAAPGEVANLPRSVATVAGAAVLAAALRVRPIESPAGRIAASLFVMLVASPAIYLQRGYGLPHFEIHNRDPLCAGIRAHTDPDGLLVVPPTMGRIRVLARRAVVVTSGQFPLGRSGQMGEWKRRLEICCGVDDLATTVREGQSLDAALGRSYRALRPDAVVAAMDRFGAEYFVTTPGADHLAELRADARFELLFEGGGGLVFRRR